MRRTRTVPICASVVLMAALVLTAAGPGLATADAQAIAKGLYRGKTSQESVAGSARTVAFKVKGSRVLLTREPVIRRGFCLSTPVFLLEQDRIAKRISRRGRFTFARTFVGSKINRISGRFVDGRIEGVIVYWFAPSPIGLCRAGKQRITFTANRPGKR